MIDPIDLVEDRLATAGCAPRRRGDKIIARCPAHDDSTPSFNVARGTNQPVILDCRAGCSTENILHALNLTWADISTPLEKIDHRVVATYEYRDEHGELLYSVQRIEPGYDGKTKSFKQLPANGKTGPGSMQGVRRVPYRLPAILEAVRNDTVVFICEGEKDADNLVKAGYEATTNAGGAQGWTASWNGWFEGARVAVVIDRDAAGYERGAYIASTMHSIARDVTILEPTDGKDVTDHLNAGHAVTDLKRISLAACISNGKKIEQETAPAVDSSRLRQYLINWNELWTADHSADWLVEPFIATGRAHTLYAGAKTGKSLFTLNACVKAALGEGAFGIPNSADPVDILYVDQEMTPSDLIERIADMGYDGQVFDHLHYMQLAALRPLDTPEGGGELVELAIELGVQLVVIDTTSRVIAGEENSADTFRYLYMNCIQPLKAAGIASLRLDHAGKEAGRGQRGSSAKNDDVDVVYRLDRTEEGYALAATHRRMGWVPEHTAFTMRTDPLDFLLGLEAVPPGTRDLIIALDRLGVPLDASVRTASAALRAEGHKARTAVVSAALKARRRTHIAPVVEDGDELI